MTKDQVKKFIKACEDSNINVYTFIDDIQTRYNNTPNSLVVFDEGNDMLFRITKNQNTGVASDNAPIMLTGSDLVDIHRAEVYGTFEQIKEFVSNFGLSLSNDQFEVMLNIDRKNRLLKTDMDYHNVFHVISPEAYEQLTPEEKEEYNAHVAEEEKRFGLPTGVAGRIDY